MSRSDFITHWAVARLVLETLTPLSIASGQSDLGEDATLVRDANGLPTIPGTSLAGVLRALHRRLGDPADPDVATLTDRLFGHAGKGLASDGLPSRVCVSHGVLLDRHGKAVEGLMAIHDPQRLQNDPSLRRARDVNAAVQRDRVRIAARGAAADTGLFDRSILPAGYRFAVEVSLWTYADGRAEWEALLNLFAHPLFRLGGGTRAGLGAIRIVQAHQAFLALDRAESGSEQDIATFRALDASLTSTRGLSPVALQPPQDPHLVTARLTLKPRHTWRIGGGGASAKDSDAALLPKREPRLHWQGNAASLGDAEVLVPASSVKGVLAHRAAYHARCAAGRWADDHTAVWQTQREDCPEAQWLFGVALDDTRQQGLAGRVYIDDQWLHESDVRAHECTHNAIDRFTGGVRDHLLFREQVLVQGEIPLRLTVDLAPRADALAVDASHALHALQCALDDLLGGQLALGARVSTGQGLMNGTLAWNRPAAPRISLDALEDRS